MKPEKFDEIIDSETFNTQPYTQITLYLAKLEDWYVVMSECRQFVQFCSEKSDIHLIVVTRNYEEAKKVFSERMKRLERKYEKIKKKGGWKNVLYIK